MTAVESFVVEGHIVDSLILAKVLDLILDAGADYRLLDVDIGRTASDTSRAQIEITARDADDIERIAELLQVHGVNPTSVEDADLQAADTAGVLPAGFHSTTNLDTEIRLHGRWVPVANPEMDCGLLVVDPHGTPQVSTIPMHKVAPGDLIAIGLRGVRVRAPEQPRGVSAFAFMDSDVSSEKPKALLVATLADRIRAAKARGEDVLAVCGPAVVHTGGAPELARLIRGGYVDLLFAGNGFAAHDIESNVLGTSLGISVSSGAGTEDGHSNHLRVINEVRRHGSIAAASEAGYVGGGVMFECVRRDVPFVLGGSIRDDGPLPDTIADVVVAADRMRELVPTVGLAMMLATTLHAIATGNILPGRVETFCVDINQAVVTKLADRGSHQTHGIVTDVGSLLRQLADALDCD